MVLIVIILITYGLGIQEGERNGFYRGFEKGFLVTADSVNAIMQKQIKSDTTVTKLILINRDTNVYIIKAKSFKNK